MLIQPNSRLIMVGDSVTECGRTDAGEGLFEAIGKGYVCSVDALLSTSYPEYAIRVTNRGIGGNNIRDVKDRWHRDVLYERPNWVSVLIGLNDVWRRFDLPRQKELHISPDEYESILDELVGTTRPVVDGMVLITPYYIEPNANDRMRAMMDEFGGAVKRIAQKHEIIAVDTQEAFRRYLGTFHSSSLAWDRIHPNHIGHMIIARAFLDAVGFSWA